MEIKNLKERFYKKFIFSTIILLLTLCVLIILVSYTALGMLYIDSVDDLVISLLRMKNSILLGVAGSVINVFWREFKI